MASSPKKCAHPGCNCLAKEGQKYCGETCASAKNLMELMCQCRHPACQESSIAG